MFAIRPTLGLCFVLTLAGFAVARTPIDEDYALRVVSAIHAAEGGKKAKVPYGVLSLPTRSEEHARTLCLNSVKNAWDRWEKAGRPGDFIEHMGRRYAPVGAANDPTGLNANWVRNVRGKIPARRRNFSLN